MNCGSDEERSDFFAFNDYSWCDPSSFQISGWDQKVKNFTGYGIPIFLSEYGCNTNTRKFEEVAALYNTEMTSVYSGGLVYEYSEEPNKFGLVSISGSSVTELPDFAALQMLMLEPLTHPVQEDTTLLVALPVAQRTPLLTGTSRPMNSPPSHPVPFST